ncbi:MAG: undecaprenyldiphospho-muramoylpentapeptide beta-N-acetylglucosaminyltransferase [Candidatus Omnitrophota bacterium]|nr:undecaprenyldiphospho-muramoylpentapeptide beta-N-acetylglucosaminyltransferase [Candidatus Omnitrophota bacterium]
MKIIIATGGTKGHINPALGLASALKKKVSVEIIFVSPNKELKNILTKEGIKAYIIPNPRIKLNSPFSLISGLFMLFFALVASIYYLAKIRPQVVVGFGGYAAFPLVFSACVLGIPAAIHEQNVVMGKANRVLSYLVKKILVSFEDTKELLKSRKITVTGNPIREGLRKIDKGQAIKYLGLEENLFTILVMGGSSGAHNINEKFAQALTSKNIKDKGIQVIHLTGKNDFEFINQFYKTINLKSRVYSFSEEIAYFFSAADLVISRAGGSTISELSYFQVPAVLIPYPYAGAHQKENAKALTKNNKAVMIEDDKLDAETLAGYIEDFIAHPEKLSMMRERFFKESELNSREKIVQEVLALS